MVFFFINKINYTIELKIHVEIKMQKNRKTEKTSNQIGD